MYSLIISFYVFGRINNNICSKLHYFGSVCFFLREYELLKSYLTGHKSLMKYIGLIQDNWDMFPIHLHGKTHIIFFYFI